VTRSPDEGAGRPVAPNFWSASRELQRAFWVSMPANRRIDWLEEAVGAAYRAGALPRRADVDRNAAPVVPLIGSSEDVARADVARAEILDRVRTYCRGPVPDGFDPMAFAVFGAELQFALWGEADARFWIDLEDASIDAIASRVIVPPVEP